MNLCELFHYILFSQMKNARFIADVFQTGSSLTSQAVSSQVLSAYGRLTSVFGMGTGGPPSYRRRIQLAQIFLCFVVVTLCISDR